MSDDPRKMLIVPIPRHDGLWAIWNGSIWQITTDKEQVLVAELRGHIAELTAQRDRLRDLIRYMDQQHAWDFSDDFGRFSDHDLEHEHSTILQPGDMTGA